jgi:hypothetical protein
VPPPAAADEAREARQLDRGAGRVAEIHRLPRPRDLLVGQRHGPDAVSRAISIAVGVTEDEAAGKRNVTPKTRAMAQAAVAEWNRKRAAARATPNK